MRAIPQLVSAPSNPVPIAIAMCGLKIKLYAHMYRDTSEIQHYVINK